MTELRESLYALVERPASPPTAVEAIAARAAALGRRRRTAYAAIAVACVGVASLSGVGLALDDADSGVDLASAGPESAGYIAEQPGGYIATGTWRLTIIRGDEVIELDSSSSDSCGRTGLILPGDEVRGSITGASSSLRVGEAFSCPE